MILDAVRLVLEGEGYRVETSRDGALIRNLMRKLEAAPAAGGVARPVRALPDLILLDVLLGTEDGLVLCRLLKSRPETRHIPVVLFSANSRVGPEAANSCGDEYLPKPFDIETLIEIVRRRTGS